MGSKTPRRRVFRGALLWSAAVLLALAVAYPAWAIIFAAPGSVNSKAIVKGAVTSAKIKDKTIKNADIAAGAAIAATKMNRAGLDADLLDGKHASEFVAKAGDTMAGPLTATDFHYKAPKTGKLSIPGIAFQPEQESFNFTKSGFTLYGEGGAGFLFFVAPVNLPDGAKITYLGLQAVDNYGRSSRVVNLALNRWSPSNVQEPMAYVSTANIDNPLWQFTAITGAGIANPIIDNNYGYYVEAWFDGAAGLDLRLGRVLIMYEYSSP